ncbi:MAG: hypothetical protein DI539_05055 [Flavobacterium psychrophilum]|nr:MAG: hypothetical protein DI539_05055 [Flavobacterium psychrophilum]
MKDTDIIVIGAGAAGLMAAHTLTKAGRKVLLLEARDRLGGRIHTINDQGFSRPVELGAEFVHGDLPLTLALLDEAGIGTTDVKFEMWQHHNDSFTMSEEFVDNWDMFLEQANRLDHDMTLLQFLEQNFTSEHYAKMRRQIESYVAGYDTADIKDISIFSLRNQWNHENEDAQHRVKNGYCGMVTYLAKTIEDLGSHIVLNSVVKDIIWKKNSVTVTTSDTTAFTAQKVIIALPLGVLHAEKHNAGYIQFKPHMHEYDQALKNIGFGSVIKILLEFDEIFWKSEKVNKLAGTGLSGMGFLFSDEVIPTFWTQAPAQTPLLTGWLGGPPAYAKKDNPPEAILALAINSLSRIFKISDSLLTERLTAWRVADWSSDPYTLGSYAYDKIQSAKARKVLRHGVKDTVFFTGEYMYDGPAIGTVEAALNSGKHVAEMILKSDT